MLDSAVSTRTVLIVDDQRTFADSIAAVVDNEPDLRCVGTLSTGEAAVERCASELPDVILMDVDMPGIGGVEATRQIVDQHRDAHVVVLTGVADATVLARAASVGARSFLLKDAPVGDVLDAVRSTDLRRSMDVDPDAIERLLDGPGGRELSLTPRELEVLGLLATGQQPKQIARALGISLHTCRGYIKNILQALDAHSALEAVVEAHRRGLIRLPSHR